MQIVLEGPPYIELPSIRTIPAAESWSFNRRSICYLLVQTAEYQVFLGFVIYRDVDQLHFGLFWHLSSYTSVDIQQ